ncbi:MAG: dihydropteroate synthase [Desulfurococcales archaeon]|nr:dihydropteroate synthase [Desulfurococcales archaeon]
MLRPVTEDRVVSTEWVADLGGVKVGGGNPVRVMGVINVSPESFYKGSVRTSPEEVIEEALKQVREGADIIDVGAKSTAPYLETDIPVEEEVRRAVEAVKALAHAGIGVPISIDTTRSEVAEAALKVGASIVNDVSGLKGDPKMASVVREYGASLIVAAKPTRDVEGADPVRAVVGALEESLRICAEADIDPRKVVIDPAIGFIRPANPPWYVWDSRILARLGELSVLKRPVLVGVSRKSFLREITGRVKAEERLSASLAATAIAVFNGADAVRTHDVKETVDAVRVGEYLRGFKA